MVSIGNTQHNRVVQLVGHGLLGRVSCYLGNLSDGRDHIERSLALADPEQDGRLALHYGQDPVMAGLAALSWCLWLLGYPDQALRARNQSIIRAEEVRHPQTLAFALGWAAGFRGLIDPDPEKLAPLLSRLNTLIEEKGFQHWLAFCRFAQAKVLTEQGRYAEARKVICEGFAAMKASSCAIQVPNVTSVLVSLCLEEGTLDEGLRAADNGLAAAQRTEERWAESELLRLRGELLLRQGHQDAGHADLRAAIDLSRRQQAKSLELRAATSCARLLQEQGRVSEARQLLQPLHDWFTEGRSTRDQQKAAALLAQLK